MHIGCRKKLDLQTKVLGEHEANIRGIDEVEVEEDLVGVGGKSIVTTTGD